MESFKLTALAFADATRRARAGMRADASAEEIAAIDPDILMIVRRPKGEARAMDFQQREAADYRLVQHRNVTSAIARHTKVLQLTMDALIQIVGCHLNSKINQIPVPPAEAPAFFDRHPALVTDAVLSRTELTTHRRPRPVRSRRGNHHGWRPER